METTKLAIVLQRPSINHAKLTASKYCAKKDQKRQKGKKAKRQIYLDDLPLTSLATGLAIFCRLW
jgi:hypothetical protein